MKRNTVLFIIMAVALSVFAVPAKKGLWKTLTLTDGTEIKAMLVGDEHGHFWKSESGQSYQCDETTGFYREVDGNAVMAKAKKLRYKANAMRTRKLLKKRSNAYRGQKKGLIILVNFSNTQFKAANNKDFFLRMANEDGFSDGSFQGSMRDYFMAQSRGLFELDFDVVGPVELSKSASYYGSNDYQGNDKYAGQMVIESLQTVLAHDWVTNWHQYDWDGDGLIDQVYLIYAGKGEADGGASSTIWPHAYTLTEAQEDGDGTGPFSVEANLKVDTYACGSELNGFGKVSGIGTMCHEFSHCLGFPDFYDIDYSGGQGMNMWDLMDQGSYNGDGFLPAGYTSYERWVAGWDAPIELETDDVEVEGMKSLQKGGESYVIYNKGHRDEYFLLENRQLDGWDAGLPAGGLLILHVDYDEEVWFNNQPNDEPAHQRMTWIPADNKYEYETYSGEKAYTEKGMRTDVYPYKTNNQFNRNSSPSAKFYNKNVDGTNFASSSVENITQNADGTVSFSFVANYQGGQVQPGPSTDGVLFYESFDLCTGKGGNDDLWSGQVANGAFQTDNDGWITASGFGANGCAKFGTGTKNGMVTTPAFAINGEAELSFRAGAWNANKDGTTLFLTVSNGEITPSAVTMTKGEFNDFKATIKAVGRVSVTFEAASSRFFLDEVPVKDPNATVISNAMIHRSNGSYFSLDGRRAGSNFNQLRPGIYVVNGKKIVK